MKRAEDPDAKPADTISAMTVHALTVEQAQDLLDAIVIHESKRYMPDEHRFVNARCRGCGERTEQMEFNFGSGQMRITYCPKCEPCLQGHPAEHHVYL